jgi:hypothetical protein
MSRTFPRATGVIPANFVSRTTRIAAPKDTEEFPLQECEHSSAAQSEVNPPRDQNYFSTGRRKRNTRDKKNSVDNAASTPRHKLKL